MRGAIFVAILHIIGPENWGDVSENCNGRSQSPINIATADSEYDEDLPIVDRSYFHDPPESMTVLNNGHTIQVNLGNGYSISNEKFLPFDVKAAQYHFHWGTATESTFSNGSEHTVDGKRYFGELHVVHYNTKYTSLTEAIDKSDGLAVFGWFISVTYPQTNLDIGNLLNISKQLSDNKDETNAIDTRFSVESLLPADISEYFRYRGSLTTPNCHESVLWTVFKKPIEITQAQAFLLAKNFFETTDNTTVLENNFRPVQDMNGRKVTKPRPLVQSAASRHPPGSLVAILAEALSIAILLSS